MNRRVPVLRGPRVTLRPPADGDADAARHVGVHPESGFRGTSFAAPAGRLCAAHASEFPTAVVHFLGKPGGRGGAASRSFSKPARRPSRKVRTPQSRALVNGQPGKPEGKRNREQTASGPFRGVRARVKR